MGRPPRFSADQILDAAALLLVEGGPGSLSVAQVAARLDAPSGSIYHRFGSRDLLMASLWLRSIERFQAALLPAANEPDPCEAIGQLALTVVAWARANPTDARVLLLYRSEDLLRGEWPAELAERNDAQRRRVEDLIESLCARLGATTPADRRRVTFAAVELAYSVVRGPLGRGEAPAADLEGIVADAVDGVLLPFRSSTKGTP